jgi:tetratricopeptide (TPR) repeat protein
MTLQLEFKTRVARRSSLRLIEVATRLLELDSDFRASFPRETSAPPEDEDRSIGAALAAIGHDPRTLGELPDDAVACLEHLRDPAGGGPPDAAVRTQARALLAGALHLDPESAAARLVGAQLDWLAGDLRGSADGFNEAARLARCRRERSAALLHRALLAGDSAEMSLAGELASDAARLRPEHVAAHWTTALFSALTGAEAAADRHFDAALKAGTRRAVRARANALERHCLAIAERCDQSPRRAREIAMRLRERASSPHPFGVLE